jgi:hypothetical protein
MLGNIEMKDLAPPVLDDKEAIQDSKCGSWHGEEIHCRDDLAVIAQEGSPELACLVGRDNRNQPAHDSMAHHVSGVSGRRYMLPDSDNLNSTSPCLKNTSQRNISSPLANSQDSLP